MRVNMEAEQQLKDKCSLKHLMIFQCLVLLRI